MKSVLLAAVLVAVTLAAELPPNYDPAYAKPVYKSVPMPFAFSYAVKDDSYGINDYSHDTTSDGTTRTGIYRTLLPDGRTQTVTYKATPNGYLADVKYEGVAKYPEYQPAYKPAYPVA